jgi:4-hydroxy-2-oxoheptanedioate aldolase
MMKTLLEPDASGDKMCIDTAPDAVKNLICLSPLPKLMNIGQNPFSTPENLVQGGRNVMIERLANGLPVFVFGVRTSRTLDVVKIAKGTGHHVLWIDLEHSGMSMDTAVQICSSALDVGLVPMVRIPEGDIGPIGPLMDGGALGIMAPMIETAEQAIRISTACRFPPHGGRSQNSMLPLFGYRKVPAKQVNALCNESAFVAVTIESERGFANLEEIAAVPGVDLIICGCNDFSADMGILGEYEDERIYQTLVKAIKVCNSLKKPIAIAGVGNTPYLQKFIASGAAPFHITGFDAEMLSEIAQSRRAALSSHYPA